MADSSYYQVRAMSHRADAGHPCAAGTDARRPPVAPLPGPPPTLSSRFSSGRGQFAALSRPYYCCWDGDIIFGMSPFGLRRTVESHPWPVGGWVDSFPLSSANTRPPRLLTHLTSVVCLNADHKKMFPAGAHKSVD